MVSAGVPPPVVKSVAAAVVVHDALSRARSSVTVTGPRLPLIVVPGAPLPRSALTGADIVSAPDVTVKVTVVSGSPPGSADEYATTPGAAAEADAAAGASVRAAMAAAADTAPNVVFTNGPPVSSRATRAPYTL